MMKRLLTLLLTALTLMPPLRARDFKYDGINYSVIDENAHTCRTKESYQEPDKYRPNRYTTYPGTWITEEKSIEIPSKAYDTTYNKDGIEFTVIEIGNGSFRDNHKLTGVSIPATVTKIGFDAFYNCENLKTYTVASDNPVFASADGAVYNKDKTVLELCPGALTSFTIPATVTDITKGAFSGCVKMTRFEVDSKNSAFTSDNGVLFTKDKAQLVCCPGAKTKFSIPDYVTVRDDAFRCCTALTDIELPRHCGLPSQVFIECEKLHNITNNLPGADWAKGLPTDNNFYEIYTVPDAYDHLKSISDSRKDKGDSYFLLHPSISAIKELGPTSFVAAPSTENDYGIDMTGYTIQKTSYRCDNYPAITMEGTGSQPIVGLPITVSRTVYVSMALTNPEGRRAYCSVEYNMSWPNFELTTLAARATSNDCAIICAETNMSEDETGGGFEWRRYDAPDLVPSTFVACPVANGHMEGKLKGLSSNTYYKYRAYYEDIKGTRTFGDWIAFYTADAYVYFEPTVYTYAPTNVTSTGAELRGYALAGSDDVTEQGFEYRTVAQSRAAEGDVQRVVVSGQRMRAQLDNLLPSTTYSVRTFATTAKGTTYGDEMTFTTAEDPNGAIETVSVAKAERANDVYTLQGMLVRRNATADDLRALRPGLYIIGGRKVLVR